jgi:hypothetical protein
MIVQDVQLLCPAQLRDCLVRLGCHLVHAFQPLMGGSASKAKRPPVSRAQRQQDMMGGARRRSAEEEEQEQEQGAAAAGAAAAAAGGGGASAGGASASEASSRAASVGGLPPLPRAGGGSGAGERASGGGEGGGLALREVRLASGGSQRIIHSRHVSREQPSRAEVLEDEGSLLALLLEQNAAHRLAGAHGEEEEEEGEEGGGEQLGSRAASVSEVHDTSTSGSLPISPVLGGGGGGGGERDEASAVLELEVEFVHVQVNLVSESCAGSLLLGTNSALLQQQRHPGKGERTIAFSMDQVRGPAAGRQGGCRLGG